ncbi:MAG: hypothetical protein COA96_15020 [SAR86 cluster bacterium]|uniref:Uncharacterized protein n=1 Tax=SAR86 cluster bacterium TaxID=2030880 RepID=A0A2A5ASA3_9GAMM|nr:MAG: hypothetical protein COA96_15020 [SAR86 cluster bacterium]
MESPNTKWTRLINVIFTALQALGTLSAIGAIFANIDILFSRYNLLLIGLSLLIYILVIEVARRVLKYVIYDVSLLPLRPEKRLIGFAGFALLLLTVGLIALPINWMVQQREEGVAKKKHNEGIIAGYPEAMEQLPDLKSSVESCLKTREEAILKEQRYECDKKKGKVRADYNFCMSLTSINTHASCIYDYDYTTIDCSDDSLKNTRRSLLKFKYYQEECSESADEYERLQTIIQEYMALEE